MFGLYVCICASAFAQVPKDGIMYVASKTLALKSSTGFFASTLGTLVYGDQVKVLKVNGNYAEVSSVENPSVSGWTSMANLSAKRILASSGTSATASEVALAGKGFNQEIENSYKSNGEMDYDDVDKTEEQVVSEQELMDFLNEGHLKTGNEQ